MDFYEKLKKICSEHGTTLSALEKTLGFSNASLSKGTPRADRLYKIAEYFNVPMEYFFDDSDQLDYYYEKIQERISEYLKGIEKPPFPYIPLYSFILLCQHFQGVESRQLLQPLRLLMFHREWFFDSRAKTVTNDYVGVF